MKAIEVDPSELRPNPWNSNIMSPDNEAKLDVSLQRLGVFKPVVCRELPDGSLEILGGQHRAESAGRIGLSKVPVINLGPMDDKKAKEISLVDNSRYGQDDSIMLAKILEEIEIDAKEMASFMPFTDEDVKSIFSTVDLALDELDLPDSYEEKDSQPVEAAAEKAPKTHTIMRFKVSIADSEKLTELLTKVKKRQGFTTADDLTNAGDALVHTVFGAAANVSQD